MERHRGIQGGSTEGLSRVRVRCERDSVDLTCSRIAIYSSAPDRWSLVATGTTEILLSAGENEFEGRSAVSDVASALHLCYSCSSIQRMSLPQWAFSSIDWQSSMSRLFGILPIYTFVTLNLSTPSIQENSSNVVQHCAK